MTKRILRLLGLAGAVAVLAAGCGGGAAAGGGGSGAVKHGGVLRVGTTQYIDSLNLFVAINSQSYNAFNMIYPQLVQYGPGTKIEGDWATSWSHSADGLTWTFHLKPNTKWSDGKPLTAADAVWTANTIIKYKNSATAAVAPGLTHVKSFTAQGPDTVIVHYDKAVGNVLPQLEQFWVLPKHVWAKYVGNNGKNLKTYDPAQHLPTVSGGPYIITSYAEKGTTAFKPNPDFYGPKSNAAGVAMTYYTNSTSMIADLQSGNIDFVDQMPFDAVASVKKNPKFDIQVSPSSTVNNISFNSNPAKAKNRELLNPKVKEALEYATDRGALVKVVYFGYAKPWANLLSEESTQYLDPSIQPLPFDVAKANQMLDSLGFKMGPNHIRIAPATTGKYAQPAHPMSYDLMVPTGLDFNVDRQFQIVAADWAKAGVKIHEVSGGDAAQAYAHETNKAYTTYDLAMWDWAEEVDPDFELSVLTKPQWYSWSDTGFNDPTYDREYLEQGTLVNTDQRIALVKKMTRQVEAARPYIQLVNEELVTASDQQWTGFYPELGAWCKCYYTNPHLTS